MTTPATVASVYVHVPFCHTICGYCDFYSTVLDRSATGPLVDALIAELEQALDGRGRPSPNRPLEPRVRTVFVGGGTPTTLPSADLVRLLQRLVTLPAANGPPEFTVEANPATVNDRVAHLLAEAGVNRVSIGAQSFDPSELRVLERIHRPAQVEQTVRACRRAGLRSLNLDLIFGVPGQSLDSWLASLRAALALGPDHLSCYGLTYEAGTPLFEQLRAGRVRPVEPGLEAEMYEATIDTLAAAGLRHYEISNFARPGFECLHNLAYWHNEPYLGIGPSAAGFVDGLRYRNVADTAEYVRAIHAGRSPRVEEERLPPDRRARETVMLELRLIEGMDRRHFEGRFGHDPVALYAEAVARHVELGLLEVTPSHLRLTRAGLLVADSVIADFL
jgi:oxygen-independent coproporphyrinogen-3 oxidase